MINCRVASIDGFGMRDDIALAFDKSQGQITENQANQKVELHQRLLDSCEYGTSDDAQNISNIVCSMIEQEVWSKKVLKSHVIWDVDTVSEAVTEACIKLGLGDEDYSPYVENEGFQVNIKLF